MSIFDKLDNYYANRKPSEVWFMVVLISIFIGYIIYILISPISSEYRELQESKNSSLKSKLEASNNYLKLITVNGDREYNIKQLNKKIANKRRELNDKRADLSKLSGAMNNLSDILYTNDNWSKFLHNIAISAKDNNLKIFSINNKVLDKNVTFGKVLDINIECQGEYGEILSFMNDLEQTKLVANISRVKLEASNSAPIANIKLSVWGVKP